MPTSSELRELLDGSLELLHVGHVLLIDGCELAFCDHRGLVGISTGAGHDVVLGLSRQGLTYRLAIDLRTGQFLDSPLKATVRNVTGDLDLPALWKAIDDTERALDDVPVGAGLPIHPSDDLSTRRDLHGLNVGMERLGSAGERHRFAAPPGFAIGLQHLLRSAQLNLEAAPVSTDPIVWDGRRVELYRVYRDHVTYPSDETLGWAPFAEWHLCWWGTMKDDGEVAGDEFQIECDGPESLLRRPLGVGFQRTPVPATGQVFLAPEDASIAIKIFIPGSLTGSEYGDADYTYSITGTTPEEILDDIRSAIEDLATVTGGADGLYNDLPGSAVSMGADASVRISIDVNATVPGEMYLGLSRAAWAIIGYEIDLQSALAPDYDERCAVKFRPSDNPGSPFDDTPAGADYWVGVFATGGFDAPSPPTETDPQGMTNDGVARVFLPWYSGGTHILFADPTQGGTRDGQIVRVGDAALGIDTSSSTVAHPGQNDRPPASSAADPQAAASIDGTLVDRQGLWLFFGKRRLNGTDTVIDEYQVARASWTNALGQQDGMVSSDKILVTEWLEPGLFGFGRPRLGLTEGSENDLQWAGDWVARVDAKSDAGLVQAVPIVGLGYLSTTDRADVVLQRMLLTTGTSSGWSSFSGDTSATCSPGDNEPAVPNELATLDAEIAQLGLAIPAARVQSVASWDAAVDTIDVPTILEQKVAFSGGYQALDVARALMQPIGWCWQLRGGRYGVFCPADPIGLADAEFVLDRSVKAKKHKDADNEGAFQQLRKWQPVDRWTFDTSWAPHLNRTAEKIELQSPDPGYAYRPGDVPLTVPAHAYRGRGGLVDRVAHVSKFWSRRHFEVKGYRVGMLEFEDCWPGTIVRITDPALVDPRGTRGITNRLAIVTAVTVTMGPREGTTTLDLLVLADRSITPRLHAPVAVGTSYDSTLLRAYVLDNYFSIESDGTWSDAGHFSEPSYTGIAAIGGLPNVAAIQWDGDTWSQTATASLTSVVTTPGSSYLQLSHVTGTIYRDMDTLWVLQARDEAENAAWVEALFAPICDDDGTYTDDAAAAQPGYPWEA